MKKLSEPFFCLIFLLMLLLPFLFSNFRHDQISEIDNSYLPELNWDETAGIEDKLIDLENYLNKRIGFRDQMLTMYQILNDRLFGLMEHPVYMYGKDGYVYFKYWNNLQDYQHLNLNHAFAEELADAMACFTELSAVHGADFYYLLIPDKMTVYPEYLPDGLNVLGDVSRTDQVLACMRDRGISYVYPYDALVEAKQHELVFNVKFDAGHWNENGAFCGICELYRRLREDYPQIPMPEKEDYDIGTRHKSSLPVSRFPISEDVPEYTLRESSAVSESDWLKEQFSFTSEVDYASRFVNPQKQDLPKLLLLHDSYFFGKEQFFTENFSEVTFIHRYNLLGPGVLETFLEKLKPDIVVFENPEASLETFHFDLTE